MIRLIFAAALALAATTAQAQQPTGSKRTPNPQKLEACKQLAKERGFTFGKGANRGAIKPRDFIRDCMRGKQK
jgi:hypothetical protein